MSSESALRFFLRLANRDVYAIQTSSSVPRFDQEVGERRYANQKYLALVEFPAGERPIVTWSESVHSLAPGATLRDPEMESKRYPLAITQAEYDNLHEEDEALYRRNVSTVVELRTLPIVGAQMLPFDYAEPTDVPAGQRWEPSAAYVTMFGPPWSHLYPGVLVGPNVLAEALGASVVDFYERDITDRSTEIKGRIRRWWDPPKTTMVKVGRNRQERRPTWVTIEVAIPVERQWSGRDLAEASAKRDAYVASVRTLIDEAAGPKQCSHCDGRGYVGARQELL